MPIKNSDLQAAARAAADDAYCPYSHFRVGAVAVANGKVFTGANVENASYGLTVCAERVAIFKAITSGAKQIDAVAVSCPDASPSAGDQSKMPCGACRQVIAEFASPNCKILIEGVGEFSVNELIPRPFSLR